MGVIIAIDGPAGSGKSTIAREVAARLGFDYLDTGAMYRAVTLAAVRRGVDPADAEAVARIAREVSISLGDKVVVDGDDATTAIRGAEVTRFVSTVAAHPAVRSELVRRQRQWAAGISGAVVEGRDIGTVVFPDAQVQVFLTASEVERGERRALQDRRLDSGAVVADLARRDRLDSTRKSSPLRVADRAVVIDTTARTIDEVVEQVVALL